MLSGNWQLVVCGINHKTSTLDQREPLQINRNEIARANAIFGNLPGVMESAIVSTCNRIEFYFAARKSEDPLELVKIFYKNFNDYDISAAPDIFFMRKNRHTAAHLLSVAAGIESVVLGENQIMGQLKDAYTSACAVKTAGKIIHRLFHQAFRVGKQVRTDTEMGKGSCSVSSAAIELLQTKIEQMNKPSILFIGINQMIALAAAGISRLEYGQLAFANRTPQKAETFAANFDSLGYPLTYLPELIRAADIIITCTGSDEPIITGDLIDSVFQASPGKKLLIVDLAIPRDVEIEKDYNSNIEIYDLEDIKEHVKKYQQRRELAIPQAQEIIDQKLSEFNYWFEHLRYEPLYNGLGDTFEAIRQDELASLRDKLPPELRDEIEIATKALVHKLLQIKVKTSEDK